MSLTTEAQQVPQIQIAKETLIRSVAVLRDEWSGLELRLQGVIRPEGNKPPVPDTPKVQAQPMALLAVELNEIIMQIDEVSHQITDIKRRLEV